MMSQAHGVKAAALPLQAHYRSRRDRGAAKLRHQDHSRRANPAITIEDSGIGMTKTQHRSSNTLCGLQLNPVLTEYLPADGDLQG